jgi:hypothetical protein
MLQLAFLITVLGVPIGAGALSETFGAHGQVLVAVVLVTLIAMGGLWVWIDERLGGRVFYERKSKR